MKKIMLMTVTFFVFGFANSQNKKEVSFGIKGGLNVSTITNVNSIDTGVSSSALIGFHVGVFGEFLLSDKFSLQPELLYSTQGVKLNFSGETGDLKLDYINIPVMAKFYVAKEFSLEFGPQIGFLTSAKAKSGGASVDVKESMKSTDFGLDLGAGYDFGKNVTLGLLYNYGLTRVQKDLASGESESKNSVFQLSVGYKF